MTFNVLDFDTKADYVIGDTPAIQTTINVCGKAGGGRVVLEGGKHFYFSSIILKENVDLHLERRAVLQAYKALEHYFHPNAGQRSNGVEWVETPMTLKPSYVSIYAKDAGNIAVSGEGAIDGNTCAFVWQVSPYYVVDDFYPRPTLIYAEHCSHISFKDVTMGSAPLRILHPASCDDVLIPGLRVLNDLNVANSDGVNPDHSTNVHITGCYVACTDGYICLKNSSGNMEYRPLKNVITSDYTFTSTSAALKIDTEGMGDFENVVMDNCIISNSNRGTPIQIRDGGSVRSASSSNIIIETRRLMEYWWGRVEPITISTHDRDEHTKSGHISNVQSSNITYDSENGTLLSRSRGNHIEDILFENVYVVVRAKSKWPKGMCDSRPGYGQRIEETKISGFYIHRADRVILRDYQVKLGGEEKNDFSHALYAEEYRNIALKNFGG